MFSILLYDISYILNTTTPLSPSNFLLHTNNASKCAVDSGFIALYGVFSEPWNYCYCSLGMETFPHTKEKLYVTIWQHTVFCSFEIHSLKNLTHLDLLWMNCLLKSWKIRMHVTQLYLKEWPAGKAFFYCCCLFCRFFGSRTAES